MADNPLIAFLASYGSTAASDSLVDENVRITVKRHGVKAIEATAPRLEDIRSNFLGSTPVNVILTGTAGDGKTFHIRKFFLEVLSGDEEDWKNSGGRALPVPLAGGETLHIVKDLSEVNDETKAAILPGMAASLLGKDTDNVYLIAANDGQLLKFWRDASSNPGLSDEQRRDCTLIYESVMTMLRTDVDQDEKDVVRARIFNLSRLVNDRFFNEIVDSVIEHEAWEDGCNGCPTVVECPIRINRGLLQGADSQFRRRLIDVMRVSAMNDKHLPIRYILVLVANILLGDSKKIDQPLLSCRTARARAKAGEYRYTNPYNNALGLNFRPRDVEKLPVFSILQTFGIGFETNNQIDRFLIDRPGGDLYDRLETIDPVYGSRTFEDGRREYVRGNFVNGSHDFENSVAMQRRRLFFLLDGKTGDISPWKLTIFQYAGRYLDFTEALARNERQGEERSVRSLIKGINRTLTGMMTEDGEEMWLARSIGRLEGAVGRITLSLRPVYRGAGPAKILLERHEATGRPQLRIGVQFGSMRDVCQSVFDLRPLQFEYLMRVSDGSLPSSFSRQCQQELRHFALVSSSFLNSKFSGDSGEKVVTVLSLSRTGQIQPQTLDV
ncbi:hypothetical protein [Sinorhizobium fredii]|uniref:hypothetical protein n=1 Tax=Rhizobium fredii TaxID=380 RepID=UPI003514034A